MRCPNPITFFFSSRSLFTYAVALAAAPISRIISIAYWFAAPCSSPARVPTAEVTAAVSLPLKDAGTSLDFAATVGTYKWTDAAAETNPALKNWGDYWQVGVSSPYQVSKDAKLVVGCRYIVGSIRLGP